MRLRNLLKCILLEKIKRKSSDFSYEVAIPGEILYMVMVWGIFIQVALPLELQLKLRLLHD